MNALSFWFGRVARFGKPAHDQKPKETVAGGCVHLIEGANGGSAAACDCSYTQKESIMSYAPLDESSERYNGNGAIHHHEDDDDYDEERISSASPPSSSSPSLGNSRKSLQEPLTSTESQVDVSDPFYVFREDLYRKLESVDESLAEYLRIVHQTVCRHYLTATERDDEMRRRWLGCGLTSILARRQ